MRWLPTMVMLASLAHVVPASADDAPGASRHLVIGTKESPPFAMKAEDGTWTGISIELWEHIASELGLSYELQERDLEGLLAGVQDRTLDVVAGAITINAPREKVMDFSHPIYSTGLTIAVRPRRDGGPLSILRAMLTWEFLSLIAMLVALLAAIGALVWLAERRRNEAQFGGGPVHGIGAGLWWSAVTMTTVGYGDKAPVTPVGRALAIAWMFTALIITSFIVASITTSLTVSRLQSPIAGPDDLPGVRVATVAGSTSAAYLERRHIAYRSVPTVSAGLQALGSGDVDAVVYDAPILKYVARQELGNSVLVLPNVFKRQDYGFALPEGSPLRESINRALLAELGRERWRALLEHYVGEE